MLIPCCVHYVVSCCEYSSTIQQQSVTQPHTEDISLPGFNARNNYLGAASVTRTPRCTVVLL